MHHAAVLRWVTIISTGVLVHCGGTPDATWSFDAGTEVGRYRLNSEVVGDGSAASAPLPMMPAGTHVVVFDIDGTLTTDNYQLYRQIMDPRYIPHAFPDAAAATQGFADKSYFIVYLTGRPIELSDITQHWLKGQGFAPGHTHFSETPEALMTTNSGVGTYKLNYITHLQSLGIVVDYAYGNEPTDVYAYEGAGLDATQIYMVGPKAGYRKTQPLPHGYTTHMPFINDLPVAPQPVAVASGSSRPN